MPIVMAGKTPEACIGFRGKIGYLLGYWSLPMNFGDGVDAIETGF